MLKTRLLTPEEIIGWFETAGWRATAWIGGENALVGYADEENLFILAHEPEMESTDTAFELYDGKFRLSRWVRVVPTPRQAAVLLRGRGDPRGAKKRERRPPEVWRRAATGHPARAAFALKFPRRGWDHSL